LASHLQREGLKNFDSLHLASALFANCDNFLTVDDKILNKSFSEIKIIDPVAFINQWLKPANKSQDLI